MTASFDPPLEHVPVSRLNGRTGFIVVMLAFLALLPVYTTLTGDSFVMTLFTRVLILAIGAVSLNLIMGYGGMVSFGHAAYLGIGGYAVAFWRRRESAPVSCNGRSRSRSRRCTRWWSVRSACARAASTSS